MVTLEKQSVLFGLVSRRNLYRIKANYIIGPPRICCSPLPSVAGPGSCKMNRGFLALSCLLLEVYSCQTQSGSGSGAGGMWNKNAPSSAVDSVSSHAFPPFAMHYRTLQLYWSGMFSCQLGQLPARLVGFQ